jgi:hypothetical protein
VPGFCKNFPSASVLWSRNLFSKIYDDIASGDLHFCSMCVSLKLLLPVVSMVAVAIKIKQSNRLQLHSNIIVCHTAPGSSARGVLFFNLYFIVWAAATAA